MMYGATIGHLHYTFSDLKTLLAKAAPLRSGDQLAGLFRLRRTRKGSRRSTLSLICRSPHSFASISFLTKPTK